MTPYNSPQYFDYALTQGVVSTTFVEHYCVSFGLIISRYLSTVSFF